MQQMSQRLIKRLSALGQYEEAVAALNAVALERPASLKSRQASGQRSDILNVCDDAFVLAQQLTHIELVGCRLFTALQAVYTALNMLDLLFWGLKAEKAHLQTLLRCCKTRVAV